MFASGELSLELIMAHPMFDSTRSYSDTAVSLNVSSNSSDVYSDVKKTYLVKVST